MNYKLRFAARCEAAGRDYNEDNFLLDYNLNDDTWGFRTDEIVPLEGKGSLLVVCDGMGGTNAGEVASAIAVETIKQWFRQDQLTPQVTASPKSIQRYIYDAIQAADAAIKADEQAHPEHEGMGTTVVLVWLINGKAYVGWCGDSRAYRFNPAGGLERLSHDHSYVQELVDAGKLSEDLAIDHPHSNVITRSLGDPRGKAVPDIKEYDIYNQDIFLLCSDGLCGNLRDAEIEAVLRQPNDTMLALRDALWAADEQAGWTDNVTTLLAQVTDGAPDYPANRTFNPSHSAELRAKNRNLKIIIAVLLCLIAVGVAAAWFFWLRAPQPAPAPAEAIATDSLATDSLATEVPLPAEYTEAAPETNDDKQPSRPAKRPTRTVKAPANDQPEPAADNQPEPPATDEPAPEEKTESAPALTPIN